MPTCDINLDTACNKLQALGNSNRLKIMCLLYTGEMNVSELQQALNLVQSGISHHLHLLQKTGLICCREEGRKTYYRLVDESVADILKLSIKLYGTTTTHYSAARSVTNTAVLDGRQLIF